MLYAVIWQNPLIQVSDLQYINSNVETYMNQHNIPGLSIAISKDDQLVFSKGFGFTDVQQQINVNPNHLFRIASISKPITSVTIMKLVEEG